jgi:D-hexose-6-phosphate mutarotase
MQSVKTMLKIYSQQTNIEDINISDIDDIQLETELESRTEMTQKVEDDQNTELCNIYVKTKM